MPPLLPDLLNQPVQIVVQSSSPDWWGIGGTIVGAALGAGLGAWLGAVGARKAAFKAGVGLTRQSKIEEVLILLDEVTKAGDFYLEVVESCLRMTQTIHQAKENCDIENVSVLQEKAEKIYVLVRLHAPVAVEDAERVIASFKIMESLKRQIKAQPNVQHETNENFIKVASMNKKALADSTQRLWSSLYSLATTAP